jgi:hypothetical protein
MFVEEPVQCQNVDILATCPQDAIPIARRAS